MNQPEKIHANMKADTVSAYHEAPQTVIYVLYVSHKGKRAQAVVKRLDAPHKPCKCMFSEHARYTNLIEAIDARDQWLSENKTPE